MDLNDVLSDKAPPARTEEVVTDVKPDTEKVEAATSAAPETKDETKVETKVEEQARDNQGRFQRTVPQEALHAERQKRQQLEAELARAREAKPPPSVLEDEDGAFKARIDQAMAPLQERLFRISIKAARANREDYDEVSEAFLEAAEKDPALMANFRASDDPGEYAYTVGKHIRELKDVNGDVVAYGEKKKAEGAAEAESLKARIKALEAENETLKASKDKQARVPQSLNSEPSATTRSETFAGPKPMGAILNS